MTPEPSQHVGSRDLARWDTRAGRALARWAVDAAEWARPHGVILMTLLAGLLLCSLFTAGAAEVYDQVAESEGIAVLDQPVLDAAVSSRTPTVTDVVKVYTNLGGPVGMPVLATGVLALIAWRRRSFEPLLLGLATGAGSLAMTVAGKAAVGRARPPQVDAVPPYESSFSFPSGHSLNAMALAGVVAYVLVRGQRSGRLRVLTVGLATVFAVTMGLTRVYLGHHWLTDVLVAWALAFAWLVVVVTSHRLFLTIRHVEGGSRDLADPDPPGDPDPPTDPRPALPGTRRPG